jgi:FAD/FMN-containing dehydrogenase
VLGSTIMADKDDDDDGVVFETGQLAPTHWGHVLDGNLHLNFVHVGQWSHDTVIGAALEPFVYEAIIARGGSISAEHGIGQAKTVYMTCIHEPQMLALMRAVKQVFDPAGILNPGKVLPE